MTEEEKNSILGFGINQENSFTLSLCTNVRSRAIKSDKFKFRAIEIQDFILGVLRSGGFVEYSSRSGGKFLEIICI